MTDIAAPNRTRRVEPAMAALAVRLGITVSQAYTVVTGLLIGVVLATLGLPGVIEAGGRVIPDLASGPASPLPAAVAVTPAPVPIIDDVAGPILEQLRPNSPATPAAPIAIPGAPAPAATPPTSAPVTVPPIELPTGPNLRVLASLAAPGAPDGVAVGPDGTIYVATDNATGRGGSGPSKIFAYSPDGAVLDEWTIDGQPEARAHGLTGLTVTGAGDVIVTDASTARVLRLVPSTGAITTVATIPNVAACGLLNTTNCEPGLLDSAPEPRGVAVAADNRFFVTDRAQGIVWLTAADGSVSIFTAFDDRLPGEGPVGITVEPGGALAVTVSARLTSVPPGLPAVVRVPVAPGLKAGTQDVITDLDLNDAPAGIVAGDSGRLYVALQGANGVLDVGPFGDAFRYEDEGVAPGFDAPTGIALREGSLIITNQGSVTSSADAWVVFAMRLSDRPVNR